MNPTKHDFPEDEEKITLTCCMCKSTFQGNKNHIICKKCRDERIKCKGKK